MGYKHYIEQLCGINDPHWERFKKDVSIAFRMLPSECVIFAGLPIMDELVECPSELFHEHMGKAHIQFNGNPDKNLSYCNLVITREMSDEFSTCRTDKLPYDFFVRVVLLLLNDRCAGSYEISSDGDREDWQPAAQFLADVFYETFLLPAAIADQRAPAKAFNLAGSVIDDDGIVENGYW